MFPVLHLTTPELHDGKGILKDHPSAIKDSAYQMSGHNPYGIHTYKGEIDHVFGPLKASAAEKTRFWLGFPTQYCTPQFGPVMRGYLMPSASAEHIPLPADYKQRRLARIAIARTPPKARALENALKQVGKPPPYGSEYPGWPANDCFYSKWWGFEGPWCLMFVDYWLDQVGRSYGFNRQTGTAFVPELVRRARNGEYGLNLTSQPEHGDLVTFDWNRDGVADHVGYLIGFDGGLVHTCDGNTENGANWTNGGYVLEARRSLSLVHAYVHIR